MSGAHHHHHDHHHGHGHGHHHHAPASFGRAFAIGIALNSGFVLIEATYGILAGSMALVADAGHNLSDVLSLAVAWAASVLAARPPSARFTYGYKSSSILAALFNAALLMLALGAILVETIHRLIAPEPVAAGPVMIVAAIGIAINTLTALLFLRGREHDINIRGAYLHMASDAAVSAGVVGAGALIALTGAWWIDPATSLVIVGVIAWGTWGLAKDSLKMGLHAVPASVDCHAVEHHLEALPGVSAVHDLHIWPMSTTETAMTAHLVMPAGHPGDAFLTVLARTLEHDFGICHATVQIETTDHAGHACAPACQPRAQVA
ncbi:cobalt transporter [Novosphingobium sediminis]|uniref:Cobalt transporter n=1 Tax=Novosphingobium sediminis TaxID=707214 RepID=A0A512AM71_9SPHN|nr:cation diffusion facilitator family transporter [Novosphingobium sediminis]GEO00805.1 cobalt transporter [Novosphingobium sediminis]